MNKVLHTGLGFLRIFFFIQQTKEKKLITVLDSKYENTWQRIFCRIQQEIYYYYLKCLLGLKRQFYIVFYGMTLHTRYFRIEFLHYFYGMTLQAR